MSPTVGLSDNVMFCCTIMSYHIPVSVVLKQAIRYIFVRLLMTLNYMWFLPDEAVLFLTMCSW